MNTTPYLSALLFTRSPIDHIGIERSKRKNSIPGGVRGEGYQAPGHIAGETRDGNRKIIERIQKHACNAVLNVEMFDSTGNNDAQIWKDAFQAHATAKLGKHMSPTDKKRTTGHTAPSTAGSSSYHGVTYGSVPVGESMVGETTILIRKEKSKLQNTAREMVEIWLHGS